MSDKSIFLAITERRSLRAFGSKSIDPDKVQLILESIRYAPSAFNEQPWRAVYARKENSSDFERILVTLAEPNQKWAQYASLFVVMIAKSHYDSGKKNLYSIHDVGMATENMLLTATSLGISSHPMAGFDHSKIKSALQITEGFVPVTIVAFGYPGDIKSLPPELMTMEKVRPQRKEVGEIAFEGMFGNATKDALLISLVDQARVAHHEYEHKVLQGKRDKGWPRWYAEFMISHGIADLIGQEIPLKKLSEAIVSIDEQYEKSGEKGWEKYFATHLLKLLEE